YTLEGIFYPTLYVTDTQGNIYSDVIAITVLSKTEMDNLLKGIWERMKGELALRDIESGLEYLCKDSRDKYRETLEFLSDELPDIFPSLQGIELLYMVDNRAKYRIKRPRLINGQEVEITYYIYFVRDFDGVLRIEGF
ncbi:MAG: hypothetical protein HY805_01155, partial [Nitrospirae bacterium]|nr:hypothetical protein [Nitrospirota bacterium]